MRKLEGSPTNSSSGNSPLISCASSIPSPVKHEDTFLGFNHAKKQNINQVPENELAYAIAELTGKPSGTKLSCHVTGDFIRYENDMTLPCSFTIIDGTVYRISQDNLALRRHRYPIPGETELSDAIWDFAKKYLSGKPNHSKLHCREKLLKTIINPETGNEFQLTHDFIIVEGKIYALSGRGWRVNGGTAKVKIAVDEEGNLWAIKLPYKWTLSLTSYAESLKREIEISRHVGFLAAFTERKMTEQNLSKAQPVLVLTYFEMDLHDFFYISLYKIREISGPARKEATREFENQMLDILLQVTTALHKLHIEKRVIHTDIKLDNILLNYDSHTQKITGMCIGDFGYALKMGHNDLQESFPRGKAENVPPEIRRDDVDSVMFSNKSDVYSLGSMIRIIGEAIALLKLDTISEYENSIFDVLSKQMMVQDPTNRPYLPDVAMTIVDHLDKHFVETDREKLLVSHGLPVRDIHNTTPDFVKQHYKGRLSKALAPGYSHYCARWEGAGLFRTPRTNATADANLTVSSVKLTASAAN